VRCRADLGIPELLARPVDMRFDQALTNPCLLPQLLGTDGAAPTPAYCIPYFYVIGAYHAGARDLFARLQGHPAVLSARPEGADGEGRSYEFMSEAHPWERMLWRGCDWGDCPRRRGAGAEPIPLTSLPGLLPPLPASAHAAAGSGTPGGQAAAAPPGGRVFGEVAPATLTFTWSGTHSLLHTPWTAHVDSCSAAAKDAPTRQRCFVKARAVQDAWEADTLGSRALPLTVPFLMRGVHGTSKVRFIALLREPVARLYSAFWFWPSLRRRFGHSAAGFDGYARAMIKAFDGCLGALSTIAQAANGSSAVGRSLSAGYTDELLAELRPHTAAGKVAGKTGNAVGARPLPERAVLESCAVNFESLSLATQDVYYHADQLLRSLYVAFLPTWFDAFGERGLLVLRAEDYWAHPKAELARTFSFLRLGQPSEAQWGALLGRPVLRVLGSENATYWGDKAVRNYLVPRVGGQPGDKLTRMRVPMHADTAEALRNYFEPYNAELARLLSDERFLWRDIPPLPTVMPAGAAS